MVCGACVQGSRGIVVSAYFCCSVGEPQINAMGHVSILGCYEHES